MRNNDYVDDKMKEAQQSIEQLKQELEQAAAGDDAKAVILAQQKLNEAQINQKAEEIAQRLMAEQRAFDVEQADEQALVARGLRQLTSEEKEFYQKLIECGKSANPKQALNDAKVTFPITTIERVFEDLRTDHPLLRYINFIYTGAVVKFVLNTNGYQKAVWGELCDEIVKEATSGFELVNADLYKLSAFIPVCKQALNLGPAWLDRYVREVLREMYVNGLVDGILNGTGKNEPIGMRRQVGPDVTVTGGVYPLKEAITVNELNVQTLGNLLGQVAVDANGNTRAVRDVILVVNPADLYSKVDPALLYRRSDGTYTRELPWPIAVIDDPAVPVGEAVFGLARRYAALMSSPEDEEGFIDYSDHFQFLKDNRVYLVKGFANMFPKDNNAFLRLDISGLQPLQTKVVVVDERTPSSDATLASLTLGSLSLTPAFDADTDTYTAATTNASNTIKAVPADAGATMVIELNDVEVANGSALTWKTGENTVTVTVTAEDGTTTETYTITVTKS